MFTPKTSLLVAAFLLSATNLQAAPGDLIDTVPLPVIGDGVSVAVDCEGKIYYTTGGMDTNLYTMGADGALLATVPTVDIATGGAIALDEMAWDPSRRRLWAPEHGTMPVRIYLLDPRTGSATQAFVSQTPGRSYIDGLAYDGSDDTIWVSQDVSTTIEHYRPNGTLIGVITPKDATGADLNQISGVVVGVGDLLYLGQDGRSQIVRVKKSTGEFLGLFNSPGGTRDEGIECDSVNFAPKLVLWSREFTLGELRAVEVEPRTCSCGGSGCFDNLALARAGVDRAICVGMAATLDGSSSIPCDATGLRYRWSSGGLPVCDWSPAPSCTVSPAVATTYKLEIACQNNPACVDADDVVIAVAVPPLADLEPVAPICVGATATIDASGSQSSGCSLSLEYRFRTGVTVLRDWGTDPLYGAVRPLASTTYSVDVRCPATPACASVAASRTVEVVPYPGAALAPLAPICVGAALTLDATASDPLGCPISLEYRFRDGATILQAWSANPTYGPFTPVSSAVYSADVRCPAAPGCERSADRSLTLVSPPKAAAGGDRVLCADEPVTLDGAGSSSSCVGAPLYEWRQGATVLRPANPDPTFKPPTGTPGVTVYTLVVSCASPADCQASDDLVVDVRSCPLSCRYGGYLARSDPVHRTVEVWWSTLEEDGTLGFTVERGDTQAGPFRSIGATESAHGRGADYWTLDVNPPAGAFAWYRVVELTQDGRGDATPAFQAQPMPTPPGAGARHGARARDGRGRGR